jgi:hypothetical protein
MHILKNNFEVKKENNKLYGTGRIAVGFGQKITCY